MIMSLNHLLLSIIIFISFRIDLAAQETSEPEFGEITFSYKKTHTFDEDVLLTQTGINEGDFFDINILENSVTKLSKFYFDNGFFNAEIDTSVRYNSEDNVMNIKYIISENSRFKVDSIIYTGLKNISPEASKKLSRLKTFK